MIEAAREPTRERPPARKDSTETSEDRGQGKACNVITDLIPESQAAPKLLKRLGLVVGGLVLVVLGILGWILPFLPGVPVLIAGLALLALASERLRRRVNFYEAKLPVKWRERIRFRRKTLAQEPAEKQVDRFFQ